MARGPHPAHARLDLPLLAVEDLEVGRLELAGDDLRVRRLGLEPVHVGASLRPGGETLGVVEVEVGEDHVLDLVGVDAELARAPRTAGRPA